jgi:hypothetical protein
MPFASLASPRARSVVGRKSLRNCGKTLRTADEREGLECAASFADRMTAALGKLVDVSADAGTPSGRAEFAEPLAATRPASQATTTRSAASA